MIKMVVCDIDGTIFNGKSFSPKLISCVERIRQDGIKFVIATGRTFFSASHLLKPLNIDTPIICYQGATIHMPDSGEVIYEIGLERDLALMILSYLRSMDIYPNIYINDKLYAERETEHVVKYSDSQAIPYTIVKNIETLEFKSLNKILIIDNDTSKVQWITSHLKQKFPGKIYTAMSTDNFCEICSQGVSKGNALKFVAEKFNIDISETIGFGDQNNDIELINAAGIGVAMGNATPVLKGYADYITDTVDNDGVVKAINKFVYGVSND